MKSPRVVLFDLGNVLVQLRPERFWEALGVTDPAQQQRMGSEFKVLGRGYESGAMSTEEFRDGLYRIVGNAVDHATVDRAFLDVLPNPMEGMEEVVRTTAGKAATALVSNTGPIHFDHCLRIIPALRHLQRFYVSYHLRALKPDRAFYEAVIAGEHCDPQQMVFIDDMPENAEGARRAGMEAIVFENVERLKRSLEEIGL